MSSTVVALHFLSVSVRCLCLCNCKRIRMILCLRNSLKVGLEVANEIYLNWQAGRTISTQVHPLSKFFCWSLNTPIRMVLKISMRTLFSGNTQALEEEERIVRNSFSDWNRHNRRIKKNGKEVSDFPPMICRKPIIRYPILAAQILTFLQSLWISWAKNLFVISISGFVISSICTRLF